MSEPAWVRLQDATHELRRARERQDPAVADFEARVVICEASFNAEADEIARSLPGVTDEDLKRIGAIAAALGI